MSPDAEDLYLLSLFGMIPMLVLVIWMTVRVFRKAGRSGWWCLLVLVPGVNIIMMWVFAFMRWPSVPVESAKDAPVVAD
jgi:uncharacterized membrane protein YhaH (DUF805 family)